MSRRLSHILDLFAKDSQLNVYAGELEVRPPVAPTIEWEQRLSAVGESLAPSHLVSVLSPRGTVLASVFRTHMPQ
jgi:hypothetical protein